MIPLAERESTIESRSLQAIEMGERRKSRESD